MIQLLIYKDKFQKKAKPNVKDNLETFDIEAEDEAFEDLMVEIANEIDYEYKDNNYISMKEIEEINSINDLYIYEKPLGQGVSGNVVLVHSKVTHKQYALKQMLKSDENKASFLREINILKQIDHPNIVRLDSCYHSKSSYYLTTSFCSGGTLLGL